MRSLALFLCALFSLAFQMAAAQTQSEGFDSFSDLEKPSSVGLLVFRGGGSVLAAGLSLNEFEFPPRSGSNVLTDLDGPIQLVFLAPVSFFEGFFTYMTPLTIAGYGDDGALTGSSFSAFSNNLALSGELGSSPLESISLSFAAATTRVLLTGDLGGASFTVDDISVRFAAVSPIPEPSQLLMLSAGLLLVFKRAIRRAR
jgi:hypothetical protein